MYCFIGAQQKHFLADFIALSNKILDVEPIVFLFKIFLQISVYWYFFNRYISEFRRPRYGELY